MSPYLLLSTLLHAAILIAAALRLTLRENISGPARLAWFIVILTLPVAGALLYLFLGEIFLSRSLRRRHAALAPQVRQLALPGPDTAPSLPAPFRYGTSINGFPPVSGNHARLWDEDDTRAAMIADIDAATISVNLAYYIWLPDRTGTAVAQALIRAATRGVTCHAMADHLGSRVLIRSPLWQQMRAAGIDLRATMPPQTLLGLPILTRPDLRNHRKIIVIDGQSAWIGSQNCADAAFSPKARFGPWIDIMLRVSGPVVNQFTLIFASDWCLEGDGAPSDFPLSATAQPDGFIAQADATGPLERPHSASEMFCTLIETARDQLTLTTPYFVPDVPVLHALKSAARRGVRVRLILPRRNDSRIVQAAARGNYRSLLQAGVAIFEYGPGLLHAKTLTIDRDLAFLGSTNLDMRSFDLNFENDLLLQDAALTQAIRGRQQAYIAQSTPVTLDAVRAWSPRRRAWNNLVATLGPAL